MAGRGEIIDYLREADELAYSNALTDQNYLYLREVLADYLDLVFYFYYVNSGFGTFVSEFRETLGDLMGKTGGFFGDPGIVLEGKRVPGFSESCRATLVRLEALDDLCGQLNGIEGMIVGGSVSYGRFYNIRGAEEDSSDIDIILVANNERELLPLTEASFLDLDNRELFRERLKEFSALDSGSLPKVLSQRFYYKDHGFTISFHCFDRNSLRMIINYLQLDLYFESNVSFYIKDFRSDPFKEGFFTHYNFNWDRTASIFNNRRQGQSYCAYISIYMIRDGEFHSSMYFNVILPERWIVLDRKGRVSELLGAFRASLVQRLNLERREDSDKLIIKSHIRYPLFRNSTLV